MLLIMRGTFAAVFVLSLIGLTSCVEIEPGGPPRTRAGTSDLGRDRRRSLAALAKDLVVRI